MDTFGGLIQRYKPSDPVESRGSGPVHVMTGMTYDEAGEPADYLLQAAGTLAVTDALERDGTDVEATLLVADSPVFVGDADPARRERVLDRFVDAYADGLDVTVERGTAYEDAEFDRLMDAVEDATRRDPGFRDALLRTVPERHRTGDPIADTRYTRHQLATVGRVGADVKVGPPREELYDDAVRSATMQDLLDRDDPVTGAHVPPAYATTGDEVVHYRARSGTDPDARILLGDGRDAVRGKLEAAPGREVANMAALAAFTTGAVPDDLDGLADALDRVFRTVNPAAARGAFDHYGDADGA